MLAERHIFLASSIKRATADYIQDNAVDRLRHDCFSLADATEDLGYRARHPKMEEPGRTPAMIDRRALLKQSGAVVATLGAASTFAPQRALADSVTLPFGNGERPLGKYPQKRPMIVMTSRPPQLETPFSVFNEGV